MLLCTVGGRICAVLYCERYGVCCCVLCEVGFVLFCTVRGTVCAVFTLRSRVYTLVCCERWSLYCCVL